MNPTNVGAIFRSAAALGMDGILLTSASSNPLYRRAIRVSMGTVFQIPWTFMDSQMSWPEPAVGWLHEMGFKGIFVASGAGLPRFMNIPGENLIGVMSSNEYLTRVNLMHAAEPDAETPVFHGRRVAVIGGGNTAMDSVRTARRLGAERAIIVYRRSEKELPARVEEVHHAKEEGIEFRMLTNPTSIIGDEKGWVVGISCVEMELGEPDESGRRSPIEKAGSDFEIPCDVVIMALGTSPNPLLKMTTEGLETNRKGCLVADEKGATTREGIFAGGDAVTGAATVILAMGAGRKAAKSIDEYIRQKKH